MRLELAPATWNSSAVARERGAARAGAGGSERHLPRGRPAASGEAHSASRAGLARAPRDPASRHRDGVGGRRDRDDERRVGGRADLDGAVADPGEPPAADGRDGAPGAASRPPARASTPPPPGCWKASSPASALGSVAGTANTRRRLRGRRPQRGGAGGQRHRVGGAQRAQDPRALGHRGVGGGAAVGARQRREQHDRQRAADPEAEPDEQPERRVAERDADAGQRPHGEGEDEGGEAEPEQHAVQPGGQRQREHAPPRLGDLAAHLGDDPRAARLARRPPPARPRPRRRARPRAERLAQQRQPAERRHAAGQRARGERHARDQRGAHAARRSRAGPACRPSRSRTATTRR